MLGVLQNSLPKAQYLSPLILVRKSSVLDKPMNITFQKQIINNFRMFILRDYVFLGLQKYKII